jgi:2-methylisocitrate lyase-like PEP mutase family enzyme
MAELVSQAGKANAFRAMHHGGRILILPNAWDVASARIFEQAGVRAIATTSAGVAFSLGYPDGERISRGEMLATVARIAESVALPVTADVESGYGSRPEDAAETARELIEAGAVGLNLEDVSSRDGDRGGNALLELSLQLEKISAIREVAAKLNVPLVVNARTDVYLLQVGEAKDRFAHALGRLAAFRDAGADCLFLPGLHDAPTIARLVAELRFPVNILGGPGAPPIPELETIGVARVSLGSAPMRATLGLVRRIAEELATSGTYQTLEGAPTHSEMNSLLA